MNPIVIRLLVIAVALVVWFWTQRLGEAVIVLILRAHYAMDVITGAFAAWFAADLASRVAPHVDLWMKG
jgi:hypothetical protein